MNQVLVISWRGGPADAGHQIVSERRDKKTFFCGCVPMEVLLSETVTV